MDRDELIVAMLEAFDKTGESRMARLSSLPGRSNSWRAFFQRKYDRILKGEKVNKTYASKGRNRATSK